MLFNYLKWFKTGYFFCVLISSIFLLLLFPTKPLGAQIGIYLRHFSCRCRLHRRHMSQIATTEHRILKKSCPACVFHLAAHGGIRVGRSSCTTRQLRKKEAGSAARIVEKRKTVAKEIHLVTRDLPPFPRPPPSLHSGKTGGPEPKNWELQKK